MDTSKEDRQVVLLADAHQDMLAGTRSVLEARFHAVVMVADEESLHEAADKLHPQLAVVDLSLPVASEVNIVRELKQNYPYLKLIMLSVHDEASAVNAVLSSGADAFVLKRAVATDLIPAIDGVLQGGAYVSPSVAVTQD